MSAAERAAKGLGGHRSGLGWLCRCPVPGHGQGRGDRSPSLSLRDGDEGKLLVKCHAACFAIDIFDELRRQGLLDDGPWQRDGAGPPPTSKSPSCLTPASPRADPNWLVIWRESVDPRATIVEHHLACRCLDLTDEVAGEVIRFHPRCPFGQERLPCMIALFREIRTDEPTAIHRTALTAGGEKIGRMMLGPVRRAAIKLDRDANVSMGIVIGEGVETCMAARQIGFRPVWALGSVGAIERFALLPGLEGLTILAEAGEPSARAVKACGRRWQNAGREVIIVRPRSGSDINDAIGGAA